MTRNIYHSQKKLALETLLVQLLIHLSQSLTSYAPFKVISKTPLGQFLLSAHEFNETAASIYSDDLKKEFLEKNYSKYKEFCDYDVFALIKQLSEMNDTHPAAQIASRLQQRHMPKIIRLDHHHATKIKTEFRQFKTKHQTDFQDWQVLLIETPHQSYSGEDDPIFVVNEQNVIQPISNFSFMINAISDKLEHVLFLSIDKMMIEDKRIVSLIHRLQAM
jgi:hypothetical protein